MIFKSVNKFRINRKNIGGRRFSLEPSNLKISKKVIINSNQIKPNKSSTVRIQYKPFSNAISK